MAVLLLSLFLSAVVPSDQVELQPGTLLEFAAPAAGRRVLTTSDEYTQAMSPLDRAVRMRSERPTTEQQYLDFAGAQVRVWTDSERQSLRMAATLVRPQLAAWRLAFPARILLIKTTGGEESGAAYCRGNAIVFPQSMLGAFKSQLLLHELFHIFTRNHPELRPRLYALIGFTPCPTVELPARLRAIKITNPDAVPLNYAIELRQGTQRIRAVPLLLSKRPAYDPSGDGNLFALLSFQLLAVTVEPTRCVPALDAQGRPRLVGVDEVDDYWTQIGRNTRYNIHPEEILADNFSILISRGRKADGVPSPMILEGLAKVLTEEGRVPNSK